MPKTATEFLNDLEKRGLVPTGVIASLKGQVAKSATAVSPATVAKLLIDKGHLTAAQAQQLLGATPVAAAPTPAVADLAPLDDLQPLDNLDPLDGLSPLDAVRRLPRRIRWLPRREPPRRSQPKARSLLWAPRGRRQRPLPPPPHPRPSRQSARVHSGYC
jgi:hypothetical protein